MPWHETTPSDIITRLQNNQDNIRDMTAAFTISLDPPPAGQPSSLQGVFFFANSPDQKAVRVKAMGVFGRLLFDMIQKNDTVQIFIPSTRTLYRGNMENQDLAGNPFAQLFQNMFADFTKISAATGKDLIIRTHTVVVPLTDGELVMDRATGFITQWRRTDQTLFYDDYEIKNILQPVPARIRIVSENGNRKGMCRLSQIALNTDFGNIFDLSAYNPDHIKRMEELKPENVK